MAFTSSDIDALKEALASGALQVRYADGRQITYRSLAEVRQILQMAQTDVAGSGFTRTSVAGF